MTAGHNALRGSGPGQNPAFDHALALVGCHPGWDNAVAISAGEWVATGNWVNDRTHGQQFKARFLKTSAPTSAEGIEKYLASGMIRGIGPVYAKKLLRAFGDKVFDVIVAG